MGKLYLSAVVIGGLLATPALAADLPVAKVRPLPTSVWDIAFSTSLMTDYNFRGISQSDRGPAVNAFVEPRYTINPNFQVYAGISGSSVKLPTDPSAEIDIYAGVRPTFGIFSFDLGVMYYWYPREQQLFIGLGGLTPTPQPLPAWTVAQTDFWEFYAKTNVAVHDRISVGGAVYYAPNWLGSGASGLYASVTGKLTAPAFSNGVMLYASGEFGHYWLGRTGAVLGSFDMPDYTTWNIGAGATWKAMTLDVRYHTTDLSQGACIAAAGDPKGFGTGKTRWCGPAVIGKLSFDATINGLK